MVAVKPPGILSQSDGSDVPDMLTVLKKFLKEKYNKPGNVFLGLLHRLDRNAGGVMAFAKTSKAASRMSEYIRERKFEKKYFAVARGIIKPDEGKLIHYLSKDNTKNKVQISDRNFHNAKEAILDYKVIGITAEGDTVLDIGLITGRTHQIRAQLAFTGHPLLGDAKYGCCKTAGEIALWAYKLKFIHPVTKELMSFENLPDYLSVYGIYNEA